MRELAHPSLFVLLLCCAAPAQYLTGFENVTATPGGTLLTGQDNFILPASSTDWNAFPYAGNALSVPQNPLGGANFVAGIPASTSVLARAERTVLYLLPTFTYSADVYVRYTGTGTPVNNIGSLSLQPSTTARYFIMLATWPTSPTGTVWDADFSYFDAVGAAFQGKVPNTAFQGLPTNRWYRWETDFDVTTNAILQIRITDIAASDTKVYTPTGWYLAGGSAPTLPLPTALRMFAGGDPTNLFAVDNLELKGRVLSPAYTSIYGCSNPAGSLVVLNGAPRLGTLLTLGIHNPLATMLNGSATGLAIGLTKDPNPCGLLLPSFGMSPGVPGEVLIGNITPLSFPGPLWNGSPAPIVIAIPNNTALIDQSVFVEGLMIGSTGSQVATGLTRAAQVHIGY
jgi:hypothetical protein